MSSAGWLPQTLAALLFVAAGYHIRGLRTGFRVHRSGLHTDLTDTLMAVVMVWMLLTPIHGRAAMCLIAAFALGAVWFAVVAVRHYVLEGRGQLALTAGDAIGCAAMTFMLLQTSGETLLPTRGLRPTIAPGRESTVLIASAHGIAMPTMSMPGVTVTSSH